MTPATGPLRLTLEAAPPAVDAHGSRHGARATVRNPLTWRNGRRAQRTVGDSRGRDRARNRLAGIPGQWHWSAKQRTADRSWGRRRLVVVNVKGNPRRRGWSAGPARRRLRNRVRDCRGSRGRDRGVCGMPRNGNDGRWLVLPDGNRFQRGPVRRLCRDGGIGRRGNGANRLRRRDR